MRGKGNSRRRSQSSPFSFPLFPLPPTRGGTLSTQLNQLPSPLPPPEQARFLACMPEWSFGQLHLGEKVRVGGAPFPSLFFFPSPRHPRRLAQCRSSPAHPAHHQWAGRRCKARCAMVPLFFLPPPHSHRPQSLKSRAPSVRTR